MLLKLRQLVSLYWFRTPSDGVPHLIAVFWDDAEWEKIARNIDAEEKSKM